MSYVLLLDTNVWSHLILGDEAKRARVRADLTSLLAKYPGASRATSGICVAECMVAARRLPEPGDAERAEALFQEAFAAEDLFVVSVDQSVLDTAATLRAESLQRARQAGGPEAGPDGGKLKLPDAIIAASCLVFDPPAILVTENDRDFLFTDTTGQYTVADLIVERVG
jgi:predicted nucleic acid-binding protein